MRECTIPIRLGSLEERGELPQRVGPGTCLDGKQNFSSFLACRQQRCKQDQILKTKTAAYKAKTKTTGSKQRHFNFWRI